MCGTVCATGQVCVRGRCEGTGSCAPPACPGGVCPACTRQLWREDWETDPASRWAFINPRYPTGTIDVVTDLSACRGRFLRETVRAEQGRIFSRPGIAVTAGARYCVSGWVRASAESQPFFGIASVDAGATRLLRTDIWLVGQACYGSGIGPVVSPTVLDGNWRWYARDFVMPAGVTFASITLELWNGVPSGRQADFDTLQFSEGGCPSSPPTVCAAASCP